MAQIKSKTVTIRKKNSSGNRKQVNATRVVINRNVQKLRNAGANR